jgi:hypothetical protein
MITPGYNGELVRSNKERYESNHKLALTSMQEAKESTRANSAKVE